MAFIFTYIKDLSVLGTNSDIKQKQVESLFRQGYETWSPEVFN